MTTINNDKPEHSWNEIQRAFWAGIGMGGILGTMFGLFLAFLR